VDFDAINNKMNQILFLYNSSSSALKQWFK